MSDLGLDVWWDDIWVANVRRGDRFGYWVTFTSGRLQETVSPFRLTAWGAARCARRGVVKRRKVAERTERRWVIRA